jgi:DNA-binding phage protein
MMRVLLPRPTNSRPPLPRGRCEKVKVGDNEDRRDCKGMKNRSPQIVYLNERRIVRVLQREVASVGGQAQWAKANGIHRTLLNRVLNGRQKLPVSIWTRLGIELVYVGKRKKGRFSKEQALAVLRVAVTDAKSPSAWARQKKIDRTNLIHVLSGKSPLPPSLMLKLGLRPALIRQGCEYDDHKYAFKKGR